MRRNKIIALIGLVSIFANLLQAQDKVALRYAESLDSMFIKTTLTKLASSEFKGRKSGDEGNILAADYLQGQLKFYKIKEGNKGSYKQNIQAFNKDKSNKYFQLSNFNFTDCYSYNNTATEDSVILGKEIVFAGYGIYHSSFNDFANVDISNKIVLLLSGKGPYNKFGVNKHTAQNSPSIEYIKSQNPKAVLMINLGFDNFRNYSSKNLQHWSANDSYNYPTIKVNELLANRMLEPTNKTIKQLQYEYEKSDSSLSFEFENTLKFNGDNSYQLADVNNLIGIIQGSDLKDEYIVLSAHYDHIGSGYNDKVYFGADDNASGVSAALEIARVLNLAKKEGKGPRRSVIILFTSAEEDGLKGSEFYVNNPIYPIEKTKVCINIDMLGRMGSKIDETDIEKGYVHAITGPYKTNEELFAVIDSVNRASTNISVTLPNSSFYTRSDNYKFHQKGIPSVLFTNGEHEDLHRNTDAVEKINFEALTKRSKLVFLTVWEFANNKNILDNGLESNTK